MARLILPRRTLLRSLGAAVSLPFLEAMTPARAMAAFASSAAPVRMACLFFANGAIMDKWRPTGDGADFQLSQTLQPLESLKNQILVLEGLTQHHARANGRLHFTHDRLDVECGGGGLIGETTNLGSIQQQLARSHRLVGADTVAELVGGDVHVFQPHLAVGDVGVGLGNLHFTSAHALHLTAV